MGFCAHRRREKCGKEADSPATGGLQTWHHMPTGGTPMIIGSFPAWGPGHCDVWAGCACRDARPQPRMSSLDASRRSYVVDGPTTTFKPPRGAVSDLPNSPQREGRQGGKIAELFSGLASHPPPAALPLRSSGRDRRGRPLSLARRRRIGLAARRSLAPVLGCPCGPRAIMGYHWR